MFMFVLVIWIVLMMVMVVMAVMIVVVVVAVVVMTVIVRMGMKGRDCLQLIGRFQPVHLWWRVRRCFHLYPGSNYLLTPRSGLAFPSINSIERCRLVITSRLTGTSTGS